MPWIRMAAAALALMLVAAAATADSKPAPGRAGGRAAARAVDREGWPRTRAGELGRRWVTAFSTGEKAMRDCLTDIMAPESLARKGVHVRVERYRDLRERFGTLTLVSVDKSEPGKVEVTLAAADLSPHEFIFTAQTEPPFKLLQVAMREPGHSFPGFGH